jgi:hypothetical protein
MYTADAAISGWFWIVIDLGFVAVLAIAIAWVQMSRRKLDGAAAVSAEPLKPSTDPHLPHRHGRWQDWFNLALGIWLCVSPWVLWRGDVPPPSLTANALIVGVLLAMLVLAALYRLEAPAEWAVIVAAAWVFVAPWLYGFDQWRVAAWDHWIVAALLVACAGWRLLALRHAPPLGTDPSPH